MGRSAWGGVGVESNRRVGWRKGVLERGEPGGGRVGKWPTDGLWGWGWKALRVPSKFVTPRAVTHRGLNHYLRLGDSEERVSRIVHWIS